MTVLVVQHRHVDRRALWSPVSDDEARPAGPYGRAIAAAEGAWLVSSVIWRASGPFTAWPRRVGLTRDDRHVPERPSHSRAA